MGVTIDERPGGKMDYLVAVLVPVGYRLVDSGIGSDVPG